MRRPVLAASGGGGGSFVVPQLDPDRVSGPAAAAALAIDTYDGSDQLVHPAVVYVEGGWNGHAYWLAGTPYPGGNNNFENPSLWVSDDGDTWTVPAGVTNPLEPDPGGSSYNSDPHLVFGPDGRLYLFWRTFDAPDTTGEEKIYYRASSDGADWTDKQLVMEVDNATRILASPSILYEGQWIMWIVNVGASPNTLLRFTAAAATGPWTGPTSCTFTMPAGRDLWHISIHRHGHQLVALFNDTPSGTNGGLGDLYFATSLDGLAWDVGSAAAVTRTAAWHNYVYRATLVPSVVAGALGFDVWYSAYLTAGPVWKVGRTRLAIT